MRAAAPAIVLLVLLLGGCAREQVVELHPDGEPALQVGVIVTPEGLRVRHGPCVAWYADGQRRAEGRYWQGRRVGPWRFWFPDGRLEARGSFHLDRKTGYWTEWNPDGTVAAAGLYVAGERVGRWR